MFSTTNLIAGLVIAQKHGLEGQDRTMTAVTASLVDGVAGIVVADALARRKAEELDGRAPTTSPPPVEDPKVAVPNLAKRTLAEARQVAGDLTIEVNPLHRVIGQEPQPSFKPSVKRGSAVVVTVQKP